MRRLLATLMIFLATAPAHAQEQYSLDRTRASVRFTVREFGLPIVQGGFSDLNARLAVDSGHLDGAELSVVISANSVFGFGSDRLRRALEVERYPTARYVSTRIDVESDSSAQIEGLLTLHGVTRPVALDVALHRGAGLTFRASGRFRRSAFGLSEWPWASDWVELSINAPFELAH